MSTPEQDAERLARRKRTVWLMAGGAASLILPLLGAIYLRWSETNAMKGPSGRADMFERREGAKLVPSQMVVPPSVMGAAASLPASGTSSLGMVQAADGMKAKPPEPPPAPAPAYVPPPAPVYTPPPMPAPKPGPKPFAMPKLQPTGSKFSFQQGGARSGGISGPSAGGLPPGAQSPQQMMQDPQVQQYLKSQGR